MKINRMAEEMLAPDWIFNSEQAEELDLITSEDVEVFEKLPAQLLGDDIVEQRERIELSASNGTAYYCNSDWSDSSISSLKEYASVCGLKDDQFKTISSVQADAVKTIQASADQSLMKDIRKAELLVQADKTASEAVELLMDDPFKLDKISNAEEMQTEWTPEASRQTQLEEKPSMMSGAVKSVRGGENYYENSDTDLAVNQNSITNPTAIETLAESEEEDTGARLRREQEEKVAQKEVNHKDWEQSLVEAMAPKANEGVIPKGTVFPTEVMNAQPGIYEQTDPQDLPEKTMGEKLASLNDERKQEIRGSERAKHEFSSDKASSFGVSDTFSEELAKHLK